MDNYSSYGYSSDKLDRRGFIDKKLILESVTQEEIFKLVFGFLPVDFQYTTSPLRIDNSPGCWFQYHINGTLYFIDFASKRHHSDCFNIVQDYYSLPNFFTTLEFIHHKLIEGRDIITETKIKQEIKRSLKESVKLIIEPRHFIPKDAGFWIPYGISSANLLEDKQFAISAFHALNTKKGNFSSKCYDLAYADTNFPNGRKKIYFPNREGKGRFITTCTREDIGGINSLPPFGRQLIITKSYKDWRVLKNQGKNAVYLQNEGMFPLKELFILCKNWKQVIIFFDNDTQGIRSALELSALINKEMYGRAKALWLPETLFDYGITDPSDLHKERSREDLLQFLNKFT